MNWRTTLKLAITALVLGLVIVLVERPLRLRHARRQLAPPALNDFDPASITGIRLQSGAGTTLLVKTGGVWEIAQPSPRPARQDLVEGLLRHLASLRGPSILNPDELRARPEALAEFGLNPPPLTLTLSSPAGRNELLLGSRSFDSRLVYYQVVGAPGVFAADASLAERLPPDATGWRDTTLLPLDRLRFNRIRVASEAGAFTLVRSATNDLWEMLEPRPARADSARVEVLLRQLAFLPIVRFVARTAAPPPESAGLRPPRFTLTLARGTNDVFSLALGDAITNEPAASGSTSNLPVAPTPPPTVYAQRPDDDEFLAVPTTAVDLLRLSYKDLLDARLLRFDPATINEVDVAGRSPFLLVRQTNAWQILPAGVPADERLVGNLLTQLSLLETIDIAKEVVTEPDLANYGLAPPERRLTLRTIAGNTNTFAAQLETGAFRDNRVFARVPSEPPVYILNPADVESLPLLPWQLRDRTLWQFAAPQVAAISIQHDGVEWTLRREGPTDWATPPGWRNDINPFALEEALHRLGSTRALSWVDSGPERARIFGIGSGAEIRFDLRGPAGTNQLLVAFGKRSPAGHRYASITLPDTSRPIFELPGALCDDLWNQLGIGENAVSTP